MKETCEGCKYFKPSGGPRGVCRRYPPTPDDRRDTIDEQPNVTPDGWCGEWAKR